MLIIRKAVENAVSFIDLLVDDGYFQQEIIIPKELICKTGGVNKKILCKQAYELVLRIAAETPVSIECVAGEEWMEYADEDIIIDGRDTDSTLLTRYGWRTDCYIIGKHSGLLKENDYFDKAIQGVLLKAESENRYNETLKYLEEMVRHSEQYYQIDDEVRPILIYKGDPVCYNILTVIAEEFGKALENLGQSVMYFDAQKNNDTDITCFIGKRFKAVIGVQTAYFSMQFKDGHYVHEYIYAPKYNFFFDHPIWGKPFLTQRIPDFHVLEHDVTYMEFIKKYYKQDVLLFPPAGMRRSRQIDSSKIYEITFVGTYKDYRKVLREMHKQERQSRFLANRFLLIMKKNPDMPAEQAFEETLEYYHIKVTDEQFLDYMYMMRDVILCVIHYYRERVIKTVLRQGLRIDVFGDSWVESPLTKYPNLICHPSVTVEESLQIWEESKISLNIMSWHKGGFTERMAGIMLAGAVLATDDTLYVKKDYPKDSMIVFQLNKIETLPERLRNLLSDDRLRERIAQRGQRITEEKHTWDVRAKFFLKLLEKT